VIFLELIPQRLCLVVLLAGHLYGNPVWNGAHKVHDEEADQDGGVLDPELARGRFARKFSRNLGAISAPNARRNLGAIWGSVARSDQNCMAILKKIGNGDET